MSVHPKLPLDRDEADLARVYRALPGGEPSPELDSRILAQARNAVAAPTRRSQTWFTGAGFGLAASAVMAAGIAWQMGWLGTSHDVSGVAGPAPVAPQESRAREKKSDADSAAQERVEIDYVRQEPSTRANEAAAADASGAAASAAKQAAPERSQSTPSPPPPPPAPAAPPAPATASPEPFPASEMEQSPIPATNTEEERMRSDAGAMQPADEARELQDAAPAMAGARRAPAPGDQAELPHWSQDAELDADAWVARIRVRISLGDRAGARNSLRQFALDHPQHTVPRDLQRLLVE